MILQDMIMQYEIDAANLREKRGRTPPDTLAHDWLELGVAMSGLRVKVFRAMFGRWL